MKKIYITLFLILSLILFINCYTIVSADSAESNVSITVIQNDSQTKKKVNENLPRTNDKSSLYLQVVGETLVVVSIISKISLNKQKEI